MSLKHDARTVSFSLAGFKSVDAACLSRLVRAQAAATAAGKHLVLLDVNDEHRAGLARFGLEHFWLPRSDSRSRASLSTAAGAAVVLAGLFFG